MRTVMTICHYRLRTKGDHQGAEVNERHAHTTKVAFQRKQDRVIMFGSYSTVQNYQWGSSVLLKWNCVSHELVQSIICLKMSQKGHDLVSVHLLREQSRYNETSQFQWAQYFCPTKALWLLFQFDIIYRAFTVVWVNMYLENHHTVYFLEDLQPSSMQR